MNNYASICGIPIIESRLVPEDQAWLMDMGNGKVLAVWSLLAWKLSLAAKDAIDLWRSLPLYRRLLYTITDGPREPRRAL